MLVRVWKIIWKVPIWDLPKLPVFYDSTFWFQGEECKVCCFCSVTPLLLATTGCTHPSHATASLHSKTENHRSFQRHHHRYHLSRSSTTIFIFTTDTTYILIICYSPKSQTCHWVQRELTIRVKAKTCVRRDKTFLRAPVGACKTMGNGLAPSWPNKWRWRWVARRGVGGWGWWAGPKRGQSGFYACSLFISCAITLKIPARCSAAVLHAVLQKRLSSAEWKSRCIGLRGCFQWRAIGGEQGRPFCTFLCRFGLAGASPAHGLRCIGQNFILNPMHWRETRSPRAQRPQRSSNQYSAEISNHWINQQPLCSLSNVKCWKM